MSYHHPRWYDYGKTDAQLEREGNCVLVMIAGTIIFLIIIFLHI